MAVGKKYEVYVQKGKPWYKHVSDILFSQIGLAVLCVLYAVGGAWAYILIEEPHEIELRDQKIEKSKEVEAAINYLKKIFWHYANNEARYNYTQEQFSARVGEDLETLKNFVIQYHNDYGYDMTEDWDWSWTFPKALLFTVTIMTTIGYGHIFPLTFGGKMFTILYAMVGMPLLILFMKDIGDSMAKGVRYTYSRICCRWCRVRRRDAELPPGMDRKSKSIMHDEVGKETYMPTDMVLVPIMINLIMIFFFLFGGALVFSEWEEWNLGPALYFCFITLTTIGFGDMTPDNAFLQAGESFGGALKMVFTVSYCIVGIMLISLALNLMQEQVMAKVYWVAREIGLSGDGNTNEEVVKITKADRLRQTPQDMTGNELDFNEKRAEKFGPGGEGDDDDDSDETDSDDDLFGSDDDDEGKKESV